MQTFLPFPDIEKTAQSLHYRHLGKQRVEVKQILNALAGLSKGWVNHPVTKMWRGYENALKLYGNIIIKEWIARGYNNNMPYWEHGEAVFPSWFGREDFHLAHRSNLIRKKPEHYGKLFTAPEGLAYIYPI